MDTSCSLILSHPWNFADVSLDRFAGWISNLVYWNLVSSVCFAFRMKSGSCVWWCKTQKLLFSNLPVKSEQWFSPQISPETSASPLSSFVFYHFMMNEWIVASSVFNFKSLNDFRMFPDQHLKSCLLFCGLLNSLGTSSSVMPTQALLQDQRIRARPRWAWVWQDCLKPRLWLELNPV